MLPLIAHVLVGLAHAEAPASPVAAPAPVERADLTMQILSEVEQPGLPASPLRQVLRLESWRGTGAWDRARSATPFAFDPTEDHGTTWTDFELQRGIGYQAGLLPSLPQYDLGLTISFSDGVRTRGRTSSPPQKLGSTVKGWIRDGVDAGVEAVPELVADGLISAFDE